VLCALKSMQGETCLILCGKDKGLEFDDLFKDFNDSLKSIVVFGEITDKVINAAKRQKFFKQLTIVKDMAEAIKIAYKTHPKNVLLSPGASSFDIYSNYKERGEHFVSEVNKLC